MIKTTKQEIAKYWSAHYPEMKLDASHCWRCGIKKRLDRCHIQAASIEGSDRPENFILLCKHCHIDSPNIANPAFIWHWLQYYQQREYEDLWFERGIREYEILYNVNFKVLIAGREKDFYKVFEDEVKKATRHFGQPSLNPATIAGVINETLVKMNALNVKSTF